MSRVEPNRNVYVGHRYVPKIFGEWNKQNEYEGLSIVTHQGASYTSKKRVPVGIEITNEEFWVVTGNYNAQVEHYRDETKRVSDKLDSKASHEELAEYKTETNQDISNFKNLTNDKVDDITFNVKDFGAVGDGITDDSTAINNAIQEIPEHATLKVPYGKFLTKETVLINRNINFIMDGVIVADHDNISIDLVEAGRGGGNSGIYIFKTEKKMLDHSTDNVGVRIHNSYHNVVNLMYVRNFKRNVVLSSDNGKGTVYNQIVLGEIQNGKNQIHITADNNTRGWTNQNTFYGGRLYHGSIQNRDDYVQILIDGEVGGDLYRNNGNTFYNTSIEDVGVNGEYAVAVECNGLTNTFNDIRTEGSMKWIFGEVSFRNLVKGGTYIHMVNIEDNGSFNRFETIGTGSKSTVQTGTHEFIAGANNTTAITASGNGDTRVPIRAYNSAGGTRPVIQIMDSTGKDVSVSIPTNGSWTVKDGTRKVHFGAHATFPPNGQRGDISFVASPNDRSPIAYVCYSSNEGGLWRPLGGIAQAPTSPFEGMSHEELVSSYTMLVNRLESAGIIK